MMTEVYNAIITRGALMPGGIAYRPDRVVPNDLAHVLANGRGGFKVVTWSEVLADRRERQKWQLARKRESQIWKPYKVWVAYFDQFIFGGWQAFVENRDGREWIDRDRQWLRTELMELFPLTLRLGGADHWTSADAQDDFHRWKIAFAQQFKRRTQDRRPLGVAYVWWDGRHKMRKKTP